MLNGAPVTPPQLNMRGALDRSRLRTLLAARREAPLETTPLLPALRDRLHVHGQREDAHGGHRRSHAALGNSRTASTGRCHNQL